MERTQEEAGVKARYSIMCRGDCCVVVPVLSDSIALAFAAQNNLELDGGTYLAKTIACREASKKYRQVQTHREVIREVNKA